MPYRIESSGLPSLRERAIESIYSTAVEPETWAQALQHIADVTGDMGGVLIFQRADGRFGHVVSESLMDLYLDFVANHGADDFRARRSAERGVFLSRDAVTDFDIVTRDEMDNHPYYAMLARHGLRYFAGFPLLPCPDFGVAITVQRSKDKPPFSEEEVQTLMEICRHAENALRLAARLADAELVNQTLQDALNRLKIGVLALDAQKQVVFANAHAERRLGDGVWIRNGVLSLDAADRNYAEEALDAAVSGQPAAMAGPRPIVVRRSGTDRPLALYVLPVVAESLWRRTLARAQAIVLIIDSDDNEPADPSTVRDVFGLTLGEARIASLIGAGASPREAGKELGLTEETARTVLKRVYEKTGITRQNKLASVLNRLTLAAPGG